MFDVFIGWDPREMEVADVCRHSILTRTDNSKIRVHYIKLSDMREKGLYTRSVEVRDGRLWDPISDSSMSTEFAISRFLVKFLADSDWAVFCDCDFLWRVDIRELEEYFSPKHAISCVKHSHIPDENVKMDNQLQLRYARKNWSSLMVWNCRHPANERLTLDMLNTLPGRDLHAFNWLEDDEIGEMPVEYNWLEGISDKSVTPKVVHYTRGGPWFEDYQDVDYAADWLKERAQLEQEQKS